MRRRSHRPRIRSTGAILKIIRRKAGQAGQAGHDQVSRRDIDVQPQRFPNAPTIMLEINEHDAEVPKYFMHGAYRIV